MADIDLSKCVDLHVHSNHSDGTYSVKELVLYAKEKGLKAIALTDHDTVSGVEEALNEAKKVGLLLVPGIEISAGNGNSELHILGLNIDHKSQVFEDFIVTCRESREQRNYKMAEKLQELGFDVSYDVLKEMYPSATVTRAHFARYLHENGMVSSKKEAFDRFLGDGKPAYTTRERISPKDAIDMILKAGGHPVLAHPLLYKMGWDKLESLFDYLKGMGLEGIEALYSLNSKSDDVRLEKMAKNHGLFITGGSDFHGSNKPDIDLGVGKGNLRVPEEVLKNILEEV
ncbi:MAG: PHP domain-containing protein [Lachnospiraceae bacterium]|nr:PHP domain-containing protein [Lachnospiraceae bacterium]